MKKKIDVKRIYEKPDTSDGYRVLVDRIWPRGIRKQDAEIDNWERDLAPSNELRKWFSHDPARWESFKKRYFEELRPKEQQLRNMVQRSGHNFLILVYGAKNTEHNNAVALAEYIKGMNVRKE